MSGEDVPESVSSSEPPQEPKYDEWPITGDEYSDASYVGITTGGVPVYHSEGRVFHGEADTENQEISPVPDSERTLEPGNALGDLLDEIGDSLGWDSLSPYGEAHRSTDE